MEVLVVAQQLRRRVPGGIGTYTSGLLSGLAAMGSAAPAVTVYAGRGPRPDPDGAREDPVAASGFPVAGSRLSGRALEVGWSTGALTGPPGDGRWDVMHATSFAYPRRTRTRLCAVVHDLAWRQVPEAFTRHGVSWHERAFRHTLRHAAAIVVPSEEIARAVREAVASQVPRPKGASPTRAVRTVADGTEDALNVAVIPLGVDHLPEPSIESTDALLTSLGVTGAYVICVGTLEPRKNIPRLIEAFGKARTKLGEEWSLLVVGPDGWGQDARVAPEDGVVFTGAVPAPVLSGLYARAALAAYVPLVEGYGLPVVEAMACGLPVVASPVPSSGGAALEVDPLDEDGIAEALVAAATDAATRSALVESGRRHVAGLTWRAAAERHVALWKAVS